MNSNERTQAEHAVIRDFLRDLGGHRLLARSARRAFDQELYKSSIRIHSVSSRTKSLPSSMVKVARKGYASITDLEDRVGIRVICPYANDIPKVLDILSHLFRIRNVEDTTMRGGPAAFGYSAYHCLAQWREDMPGPMLYNDLQRYLRFDLKGQPVADERVQELQVMIDNTNRLLHEQVFEVQVRTILQHAWASISHEIPYKRESEVSEAVHRRLARLSAILEEADEAFSEEVKKDRQIAYGSARRNPADDTGLTASYLQEFAKDVLGVPLTDDGADRALKAGSHSGLRTTREYEDLMIATLEALESAFSGVLMKHLRRLDVYMLALDHWITGESSYLVGPQEEILDQHRHLVEEKELTRVLQRLERTSSGGVSNS